ncbi:MAG: AmmeMemoRadiSam system protein B [Thermodesulfobacteriota bacterium]|nr:AmmeMemoRadiSam system protein B [Thermodesulfobacteriota bacterium]
MLRKPAVADVFYPGDKNRLTAQLESFLKPVPEPKKALAVISPHAGYVYSGGVAGSVFSEIRVPPAVVILGPNHRGIGAPVAISTSGVWETPLGSVLINEGLARSIFEAGCDCKMADDPQAHALEHSLEVQVPFLQILRPDVTIVPLALSQVGYKGCQEIGLALAKGIEEYAKDVLMVASTDMTHYESQEIARANDQAAIDKIVDLDPKGLYDTVADNRISMCGVIPTTIALVASKALGATTADLVKYATSGDVTGDYAQVVGYAGFVVS